MKSFIGYKLHKFEGQTHRFSVDKMDFESASNFLTPRENTFSIFTLRLGKHFNYVVKFHFLLDIISLICKCFSSFYCSKQRPTDYFNPTQKITALEASLSCSFAAFIYAKSECYQPVFQLIIFPLSFFFPAVSCSVPAFWNPCNF